MLRLRHFAYGIHGADINAFAVVRALGFIDHVCAVFFGDGGFGTFGFASTAGDADIRINPMRHGLLSFLLKRYSDQKIRIKDNKRRGFCQLLRKVICHVYYPSNVLIDKYYPNTLFLTPESRENSKEKYKDSEISVFSVEKGVLLRFSRGVP